ncbi:MAG: family oxidoreductase [Phenylobacterium sp.]|nr:family oxidoreductase [Phenylobacterium sp.]
MRDFFGLEGKVALVVGGGLGMGESTCVTLAEAGCDVAVADIDRARAEAVAGRVRELGRRASVVVADVLDETTAAGAVAQVQRDLGRLDVMATIVGQATWSPMLEMTPETWDADHRRNLRYVFFYAQAAAQAMVAAGRGGAIAAVASVSGVVSGPNHSAYGAAKAGLINLVRSMAVELAQHNIRVNAVAPGVIRTPRLSQGVDPEAVSARLRSTLIPFGRHGETQEIANALLFLLSDLASFVSGTTLPVDGGFTSQFLYAQTRNG